jgi:uncharacterized protein with FMN-binding domain
MKKFILAAVVILGSVGYVLVSRSASADAAPFASATQTSSDATPVQTTQTSGAAPAATKTTTTPIAPKPTTTGQYKDGTYTGSVADAYYGTIQVAAVISGGKLTNVNILQYPNDRGTSVEINQQALPILVREAIAAQSSHVNGVSGASDTSPAFDQSLASALAKAQA